MDVFGYNLSPFTHCPSQQGVWVSFWTPEPLKTTQDTYIFCEEFLEMSILSI